MEHQKFHYKTMEDIHTEEKKLGISLPFSEDYKKLYEPLSLYGKVFANRLAIAPMEGNDSDERGFPTESTSERYLSYARGGAGVIWSEAVAVTPEGRSGKAQLMLNEETLSRFAEMNAQIKQAGRKANGYEPLLIMQANHSGRYAKPEGFYKPLIAYHHPVYENDHPLEDNCLVSDDYLDQLIEIFDHSVGLCKSAGFDAVDIKCCHGYLLAELASAYTRPGKYGGSFENRFRFLLECVRRALRYQDETFHVTLRLGIYDGFAYPYGWGVKEKGLNPDYSEALKLVGILHREMGIEMINITMGNPYVNSHVTRPFDRGKYIPLEHPLEGVARMYEGTRVIKNHYPKLKVMASAPSYLRQFSPDLAAGAVAMGYCDLVSFGRQAFADPGFPNEIRKTGKLDKSHTCVTCGGCGELVRAGKPCGCVVRKPDRFSIR